ncbi:MAG: FRG domain-containing protein [Thermodesulfobacteriota bacterium]
MSASLAVYHCEPLQLALIQHYGGPTRLLDFTESIYISAFFAMENATQNSAIWALNEEYLWQHTDNVVHENETLYDLEKRGRNVVEKNISGKHSQKIVMMATPERLNERISVQQGVFVIPGDLNYSFIENLEETFSFSLKELHKISLLNPTDIHEIADIDCLEAEIVKIVLPVEIYNSALYDLDKMNINAATLFPGLEGFARSLSKHLRDAD